MDRAVVVTPEPDILSSHHEDGDAVEIRRSYWLMLGSAAAFATMSACGHALGDRCDWRIVAIFRAGLVFLFALIVAVRCGVTLVWRGPLTLWVRSLIGSIGMLCTFYALTHLPVSTAVTLFNTFPFWVALLSWPILGRRPSLAVWGAIGCGLVGVCLVTGQATDAAQAVAVPTLAVLVALAAALCTSVVMIGLHRLRSLDSLAIVVHFSATATVVCAAFAATTVWAGRTLAASGFANPGTIALLAGVGSFATLGQIAMTRAFGLGPPDRLAVIGLMQVVFGLMFDLIIWQRWQNTLAPAKLAGIALIVVPAGWLVAFRPR